MKAKIPKSFLNLPVQEKEIIAQLMRDECERVLDEQEVKLFTQYIKLSCYILHTYFGFGEHRLTQFIGNFKTMRRNYRSATNAMELEALVDKDIEQIFKNGFPIEFIEELQRGKQ